MLARHPSQGSRAALPPRALEAAHSRPRGPANYRARGCPRRSPRLPTLARQRSQRSRARLPQRAREAAHACARGYERARAMLPRRAREAASERARGCARRCPRVCARLPTLARQSSQRSRGKQRRLARQAAQARGASCPRSRGKQRALASRQGTIAQHPRARGKLPTVARQRSQRSYARHDCSPRERGARSTLARGRPRSPRLGGRVASFRARSGLVPSGAATAVPWGPDAAISLSHARNHHGQQTQALENSFKNRRKWRDRDTKKLGRSSKRHRNGLKF